MRHSRMCAAVLLLMLTMLPARRTDGAAQTAEFVVGVNVVNPMRATVADQNATIGQLKAAGVRVIGASITPDDKGVDFAKRVYAQGIKIQLGLSSQYPPTVPTRPYQPDVFTAMWSGHPLSFADPELSRVYFQALIGKLEAEGIVLAAFALGNEINWAAFNAEFPLPGEGKVFSLNDLYHDPEGKQIARGFLQYLKILAVLKDVRDHSKLNRHTPILTAGLVAAADGDPPWNNKKEDKVSLPATIAFLRANGLDTLVDAYAIHTYPSSGQPGNAAAAANRTARFSSVDMAECRPAGSKDGKPCWITEWGFQNPDISCPTKDSGRAQLIKEMRANFAREAAQGRLVGATYFAWNSDPWAKTVDPFSIYRCGELTESGREAIKPIDPGKNGSGQLETIENLPKAAAAIHGVGTSVATPCMECIRIRVGLPQRRARLCWRHC